MSVVRTDSTSTSSQSKPKKSSVKEEEFAKTLTDIIRRDFFPDIAKLEVDLGRADSTVGISVQGAASVQGATSIRGGNTETSQLRPGTNSGGDVGVSGDADEAGARLGLDQYLSKHESEDDASFKEILDRSSEAHQQKHAWLHQKEVQYAILQAPSTTLALTEGPAQTPPSEVCTSGVLNSWTYTAKNSLMYIPDGVDKSAMEVMKEAGKTREIVHDNTRLSRQFVKKLQQVPAPSSQIKPASAKEKIGVDGRTETGEDSPQVQGYGFIATPQIQPGVDASPLMTWGTIEGTPQLLDTDVTPAHGPAFKLPKESVREKVALKLADQVGKANRLRKIASIRASPALLRSHLGSTPSNSQRLLLLSPAARRLVSRRSGRHSDKSLTASYTPKTLRSGRSTPDVTSSKQTTPLITPQTTPLAISQTTPHLSDNLLKLQDRHN